MRILKITTLPTSAENWIDRDMIMLHACFQLLVDFVEKEDGLNHCNYEYHKETIDELSYLYNWWKRNQEFTLMKIDDVIADGHLSRLIKHRGFMWT